MKPSRLWLIRTPLIIACIAMVIVIGTRTGGTSGNDAGRESRAPVHPRAWEVLDLVRTILAESDADQAGQPRAIDRVFAEPADEFPPKPVVMPDETARQRGADPGVGPRAKLLNGWWVDDFGARHGGAALAMGDTGGNTRARSGQWVEEEPPITLDPMMKIDRVNLNGAVIDKEAETPYIRRMSDNQGAMTEAGYFLIDQRLEPFVRYEWPGPEPDLVSSAVSKMGMNYYIVPHEARFSVWMELTDPTPGSGSAGHFDSRGLIRDGGRDQMSLRGQFQLWF